MEKTDYEKYSLTLSLEVRNILTRRFERKQIECELICAGERLKRLEPDRQIEGNELDFPYEAGREP